MSLVDNSGGSASSVTLDTRRCSGTLLGEICTIVHGDDYVSSGFDQDLLWLEEELSKAYEIKTQKLGLEKGRERQGKAFNRFVSRVDECWTIEADQRHAEFIVEQVGVEAARVAASPGVDGADGDDKDDDENIVGTDLT